MAHLSDMEELLGTIHDKNIRDYMAEAMACYMAGAYRAAVVLTFIAIFDDTFNKLGELARVNAKARSIYDAATRKRFEQDVFETYLIEQLKANAFLSGLDADFLDTLRRLRNKAAHPSGHIASAEEARFVFFEAISRFLSKPVLSTTQLVDEIIAGLKNTYLFPAKGIGVVVKVVKKEILHLHPEAFNYLVRKLLDKVDGTDVEARKNAYHFLGGLAALDDLGLNTLLKSHLIEKRCSDKKWTRAILTMFSANAKLFTDLDEVTYERISVLMDARIDGVADEVEHIAFSHPVYVFGSLFSAGLEDLALKKMPRAYASLLDRFSYSAFLIKRIKQQGKAYELLLSQLVRDAASDHIENANYFAELLPLLDDILGKSISDRIAFEMLVGVIYSAERGADSAMDVRRTKFKVAPTIVGKARNFLEANPGDAKALACRALNKEDEDLEKSLAYLGCVEE